MKFLNNKEAKKVLLPIEEHWSADLSPLLKKYVFVLSDKQKLYAVNREVATVDVTTFRLNTAGVHLASLKDHQPRLSVEGSEIIGPLATKNVVEITKDEAELWIRGKDLCLVPNQRLGTKEFTHTIAEYDNGVIESSVVEDKDSNELSVPDDDGFVIVRCGRDWMGTGLLKEYELRNYLSKTRRITSEKATIEKN